MADPTPEERATTVRAALHSWKGYGPPYSREQDSENKRQALAAFDAAESERAELARKVEELREALRSLADYGPLEDTIRWNEMDSGHRSALMIARTALSEPTEGVTGPAAPDRTSEQPGAPSRGGVYYRRDDPKWPPEPTEGE